MGRIDSKWRCKNCNDFTEHTGIQEDTNMVNFIIYSADCTVCKTTNLNAFSKLQPNPMYGIGATEALQQIRE